MGFLCVIFWLVGISMIDFKMWVYVCRACKQLHTYTWKTHTHTHIWCTCNHMHMWPAECWIFHVFHLTGSSQKLPQIVAEGLENTRDKIVEPLSKICPSQVWMQYPLLHTQQFKHFPIRQPWRPLPDVLLFKQVGHVQPCSIPKCQPPRACRRNFGWRPSIAVR